MADRDCIINTYMTWFFWRNDQQLLLKFVPYELLLATIAMHSNSMAVLRELQLIHLFRTCQLSKTSLRSLYVKPEPAIFSTIFFFKKPFFVRGSHTISLKVCILLWRRSKYFMSSTACFVVTRCE